MKSKPINSQLAQQDTPDTSEGWEARHRLCQRLLTGHASVKFFCRAVGLDGNQYEVTSAIFGLQNAHSEIVNRETERLLAGVLRGLRSGIITTAQASECFDLDGKELKDLLEQTDPQISFPAPKGITALDPTEQKLHEARERGRRRLAQLWKAAGPFLEIQEVCRLLGATPEFVQERVHRRQLLALAKGEETVFPAFQFKNGAMLHGIPEVLAALETKSASVVLSFLLSRNLDFGNRTAVELLHTGEIERVIFEARGFLKHGC